MASFDHNLAEIFDKDKAYPSGQILINEGKLYFAKEDITGGHYFNPEKFQQIYLADLLRGHLNSNLAHNLNLTERITNLSNGYDLTLSTSKNHNKCFVVINFLTAGGAEYPNPKAMDGIERTIISDTILTYSRAYSRIFLIECPKLLTTDRFVITLNNYNSFYYDILIYDL